MSNSYILTDEQMMVKDTVHRMAQEKIAPLAAGIDETGELPQEVIEQFLDLGLFGLALPEALRVRLGVPGKILSEQSFRIVVKLTGGRIHCQPLYCITFHFLIP